MTESGANLTQAASTEIANLPGKDAASEAAASAILKNVEERVLLSAYIDRLAPPDYSNDARATLLLAVKRYTLNVIELSKINRIADGNPEYILARHVSDSERSLRTKKEDVGDKLADWCKWIGFLFAGLFITQIGLLHSEVVSKHTHWSSVVLLVIYGVLAGGLLFAGAHFNKPWEYFMQRRDKDRK